MAFFLTKHTPKWSPSASCMIIFTFYVAYVRIWLLYCFKILVDRLGWPGLVCFSFCVLVSWGARFLCRYSLNRVRGWTGIEGLGWPMYGAGTTGQWMCQNCTKVVFSQLLHLGVLGLLGFLPWLQLCLEIPSLHPSSLSPSLTPFLPPHPYNNICLVGPPQSVKVCRSPCQFFWDQKTQKCSIS